MYKVNQNGKLLLARYQANWLLVKESVKPAAKFEPHPRKLIRTSIYPN